jgi:cytochrome b involved in lipid metabolism
VIVVDNVVYDCTDFLPEHPGGEQVIKSFAGAECSWQFWRFHGTKEMEEFGRQLRVGRTEGLRNKFSESKRYIGLRRLGD